MNTPHSIDVTRPSANPLPALDVFHQPVTVRATPHAVADLGGFWAVIWMRCMEGRRAAFWLFVRQQLRAARGGQHPRYCQWGKHGIAYGDRRLPRTDGICRACRDRMYPTLTRTRPTFSRPTAYRSTI